MKTFSRSLAYLGAAALTLSGCAPFGQVALPYDSSPPVFVWNVLNRASGEQFEQSGDPVLHARIGDSFRVTLKGQDPQGVRSIRLNRPHTTLGAVSWMCDTNSRNPSASGMIMLERRTRTFPSTSNGVLQTEVFLSYEFSFDELSCPPGMQPRSASAWVTGEVRNFAGDTALGMVSIYSR